MAKCMLELNNSGITPPMNCNTPSVGFARHVLVASRLFAVELSDWLNEKSFYLCVKVLIMMFAQWLGVDKEDYSH